MAEAFLEKILDDFSPMLFYINKLVHFSLTKPQPSLGCWMPASWYNYLITNLSEEKRFQTETLLGSKLLRVVIFFIKQSGRFQCCHHTSDGASFKTLLYRNMCVCVWFAQLPSRGRLRIWRVELVWETRIAWIKSNLLLNIQIYNMSSLHKSYLKSLIKLIKTRISSYKMWKGLAELSIARDSVWRSV
jgi:hypothetical protein